MAQTLKTPAMAMALPRPIKLIRMQKRTEIQTAFMGVFVVQFMEVQMRDRGRRRSREKAHTVRPKDCCRGSS